MENIIVSVESLEVRYSWLLQPLRNALNNVNGGIFDFVRSIETPEEFRPVATQIFFHSVTFPKAIGLMLSIIPIEKGHIYKMIAGHAFDESDHHLLLVDWMVQNCHVGGIQEVLVLTPTIETRSCINLGYEIAMEQDIDSWIVCINCAIECCFYHFFCVASEKMHELGVGHVYFDTHVEADQFHSVMGLQFLSNDINEGERFRLVRKALDSMSLWFAMTNSWTGKDFIPKFTINGDLL